MTITTYRGRAASLASIATALVSSPALAEHDGPDPLVDVIVVTGERDAAIEDAIQPDGQPIVAPDAANLVARAPGASLIDNGSLSGQVQYRGSFGDRVLVRVNGQRFGSAGPNWMDPPLHYAPMVLVDRIELDRGISPVSKGPGLAGGVDAVLKSTDFASGTAFRLTTDIGALYRSVDNSYAVGGLVGVSNENWRFGAIAAWEEGEDYRFPGGTVSPTSFERLTYGAHAGFRSGAGEFSLEYRRQETGPTGNPPFAMDIRYFDSDFVRLGAKVDLSGNAALMANLGYVTIAHLMDNFSLRPAANPMMLRATYADADTLTGDLALELRTGTGTLTLGADLEYGTKQVRITNPANSDFFLTSLNGIETSRHGGFVQWRGGAGPVEAEIGARIDRHGLSAAAPETGSAVPMGPTMLARMFAASNRDWSETTYDVAARLWADLGGVRPRLNLARKTRVASPLERFSWLPTEASAGLADGNIYVGNPALKNETMWIAEAGFDLDTARYYLRPTVFYRRIDDFIQGIPFDATVGVIDSPVEVVAAMNGDPTPLKWANVDAELYGADLDFGAVLAGPLRVDGVASYVRGKRRDIADNLYRIAPPNIRLGLSWDAGRWSLTAEGHAVAKQDRISASNGEVPTGGYVLANIYGGIDLAGGLRLDAGIENLFDRSYVEHLAGYNRAFGSDVAVGDRMPGTGRSGFARLRLRY